MTEILKVESAVKDTVRAGVVIKSTNYLNKIRHGYDNGKERYIAIKYIQKTAIVRKL